MAKLKQPLNEVPSICMDLTDIKIIADHYGLDFGECRVITATNQIGMMGSELEALMQIQLYVKVKQTK